MKSIFAIWLLILIAFFASGCRTAFRPAIADPPPGYPYSGKHSPATSAAKTSPVAASVAKIVYLIYAAGICCLVAAGLLIYFGQIIPGAKCAVAGFLLPIAATWLNYHYAIVIAGALIASAVGFLWAYAKHNPSQVGWLKKFSARAIDQFDGENDGKFFGKEL